MTGTLWLPGWLWHPLNGNGYQFWSGIGSDIGELALVTSISVGFYGLYKHHQCHVDGCRRTGHHDPVTHAPACRAHHTLGHLHGRKPLERPEVVDGSARVDPA